MPPLRFVPLIERKIQTAAKAREFWSFLCVKGPSTTSHHEQSHASHSNPGEERKQVHKSKGMSAGPSATADASANVGLDRAPYEQKTLSVVNNSGVISSTESFTVTLPVCIKFGAKKSSSKRKLRIIFQDDDY